MCVQHAFFLQFKRVGRFGEHEDVASHLAGIHLRGDLGLKRSGTALEEFDLQVGEDVLQLFFHIVDDVFIHGGVDDNLAADVCIDAAGRFGGVSGGFFRGFFCSRCFGGLSFSGLVGLGGRRRAAAAGAKAECHAGGQYQCDYFSFHWSVSFRTNDESVYEENFVRLFGQVFK